MSWWHTMTGRGGEESPPPASVTRDRPWKLEVGDIMKIGLLAPAGMADCEARVVGVRELSRAPLSPPVRRVVVAEANSVRVRMWESEGGELAVARALAMSEVETLFKSEKFARLFGADRPASYSIKRRKEVAGLDRWTGQRYFLEGAIDAVWRSEGERTETAHMRLVSDERRHAIEIDVHEGGRTEVYAVAIVPAHTVEELWPQGS